ncbi:UNVERIFIED_ORG: hypothetical protein J2Y78_002050 [Buttiauxella agrestis ATCC 33320]
MPLETPLYIDTLVPEWPTGADPLSAGDDHIRVIKQVLQNTFPAITEAVTGTAAQLNQLTQGMIYQAPDTAAGTMATWRIYNPDIALNHAAIEILAGTPAQMLANQLLAVNWQTVINHLMPVGHVLTTKKSGNPVDWLGFGTWTPVVGMVAGIGTLADGSGMSHTINKGANPGTWRVHNSHIVTTTLNLTMDAVPDHEHTVSGLVANNDTSTEGGGASTYGDQTKATSSAGGHTPAGKVTIGTNDAVTGNKMVSPHHGIYVWERTA